MARKLKPVEEQGVDIRTLQCCIFFGYSGKISAGGNVTQIETNAKPSLGFNWYIIKRGG